MKQLLVSVILLSFLQAYAWSGILNFTAYHNSAQVDAALNQLAATYPTMTQISTIGTSIEGRPIKVLKIATNPAINDPAKGDVVFVALHHAREWIAVEVALYLADEMLARYASDAVLQADMNNLQIWIVPIVNPDGFAYTQSTDRYWRKNRRNNGDGTFGVDPNRNWGYQWGLLSGSSAMTSSETYHGTGPFSEPEVVTIRNFLQGLTNLKCFLTYHSYSELFLRPWSYTTTDPPGESTLRSVVQRSIARIAAVHGHTYSETIGYTSSGEATDYVWNEMRSAPFTPELRPTATGFGGFAPPASEILPCCEENLAAATALVHDAGRTGVWIKDYNGDTGAEPSAVWTGSGWSAAFWESPDIWTVPAVLNQGAVVTLNVHVRNNTGVTQSNVTVETYYTDPRISLEFPNPDAVLISTQIVTVPAGGTTITMPWTVPVGTNSWGELHWCVGVVIKHDQDMPLTTQVNRSSNIGCRNFNTTTIVESNMLMVAAENFLNVTAELQVKVNEESLPRGWTVHLPPLAELQKMSARECCASERKARLLNAKGLILEPGQNVYIPVRVTVPKDSKVGTEADLRIHGALLPLVAGKREPVGNGYTYHLVVGKH
ncbi:MAG: hypothetical protein HY033_13895 [Ignavibacteriae bacterium]|nr:hypothetical protein [Ignavibacteriota bacterium]